MESQIIVSVKRCPSDKYFCDISTLTSQGIKCNLNFAVEGYSDKWFESITLSQNDYKNSKNENYKSNKSDCGEVVFADGKNDDELTITIKNSFFKNFEEWFDYVSHVKFEEDGYMFSLTSQDKNTMHVFYFGNEKDAREYMNETMKLYRKKEGEK